MFSKLKYVDPVFMIVVLALTAYGLVMVFSASAPSALSVHNDSLFFFKKQALWAGVGIILMFITACIDYKTVKKLSFAAYIAGLLILAAVFLPGLGKTINGARRWLDFGFTTVQPSEIVKITVVLMLAQILIKIKNIDWRDNINNITGCGVIVIIPLIMLAFQKHMSAMIILVLAASVMMIVSGIPFRFFVPLGAAAGAGGAAMILFSFRAARFQAWLNPFSKEYFMKEGWQPAQSLFAVGSGGFGGLGLGRSRQKFLYIPEPQNDYIFSIICEELGFLGALLVIILFAVLLWRAFKIAISAPDDYSMLVVFGLISITVIQAALNIAVATNSIPSTGISLPFFSAGGTSFLFQMISMGIILNISAAGDTR
jgi:cell division protein FtsW